ncbi:hypothetical protein DFP72DRAFT_1059887 [Ephemerocybe angulata]|uniref:F-box domain-containing protein n=1 Tax=Ephemerocybe angulata TaxID=980116 RepID=A0A8H6IGB7_9AGAR|nr:hypothetical protein DFP72DRAFT_1059887 [Tulosesus angulatus]
MSDSTSSFTHVQAPTHLPYEIWAHVASFLSSDVLDVNFSFNRAFFHCAMDARYRSTRFGEFPNPQAFLAFKRLKDPSLSSRVRDLTYRHETLPMWMNSSSAKYKTEAPKGRLWRIRTLSTLSTSGQRIGISEHELIQIISGMKNLTNLTLESHCPTPFLYAIWPTFKASLQSLVLNMLEIPDWFIPSGAIPHLRSLTVHCSCPCTKGASSNTIHTSLGPYLNAHRDTLQSITLSVHAQCNLDLSLLFKSLSSFTELTALSLTQPSLTPSSTTVNGVSSDMAKSLRAFIAARAPNLESLSINLYNTLLSAFLSLPPPTTTLQPRFKSLQVQVWSNEGQGPPVPSTVASLFPPLCLYLRWHIPTLTKLDLGNVTLSFAQVKVLLQLFQSTAKESDGVAHTPLRSLHLAVVELEPELFVYASTMLPRLQTLGIAYVTLKPNLSYPRPQENNNGLVGLFRLPTFEFTRAMQAQCYFNHWELEHLHIRPLRHWPWSSCKETIADVFPRVKTFNGASRAEYLSSANMSNI